MTKQKYFAIREQLFYHNLLILDAQLKVAQSDVLLNDSTLRRTLFSMTLARLASWPFSRRRPSFWQQQN